MPLIELCHKIGAVRRRFGPRVFETAVGIKYRGIGFDSDRFQESVTREIPLTSSGVLFADLLLPPDMLKDCHTSCTKPLPESPHFRMIQEIMAGKLHAGSEYLWRCARGTLDNRPPLAFSVNFLLERHRLFCRDLQEGKKMYVYAVKIMLEDKKVFVIVDGKHRTAAAAAYGRPDSLLLRVVSGTFIEDRFFQRLYGYTLKKNPMEYSKNQKLIRVLQHESSLT